MIKKDMSFDVVKLDDANCEWSTQVDKFGIINFTEINRIDDKFKSLIGSITNPTIFNFEPNNGPHMFLKSGNNKIWDKQHPQYGTPIDYEWEIVASQHGASLIYLGGFSSFGNLTKIAPYSLVFIPNFNSTELDESYKVLQETVEQNLAQVQKELKAKGIGRFFRSEEVLYAKALIKIFDKSNWYGIEAFANLHGIIQMNYSPQNDFNRNLYEMVIETFRKYGLEFS